MEFKKIPGPAPVPQPYVDPDTQMKQSLRLMAKRMLYGTRGLLFIVGSLLLVIGLVELCYMPENPAMQSGYWDLLTERVGLVQYKPEVLFAFMDIGIAVLILLGGCLVNRLPLFFTLVPALLFIGKILWSTGDTISRGGMPNILFVAFQLALAGMLIRGIFDARAYRREVALAREYFRSTAILRMKESRR